MKKKLSLRKDLEKAKSQEDKFKKSSILLDDMLASQKVSKVKEGLGFEKRESSKEIKVQTMLKRRMMNKGRLEIRRTISNMFGTRRKISRDLSEEQVAQRYPSFNGYCYFCNKLGHKAVECRCRMNQNFQSFLGQCSMHAIDLVTRLVNAEDK